MLRSNEVGPKFFETLGIPILAGRSITEADTKSAMGVAVVNQTLAQRYLKGASPIGHTTGRAKYQLTIVGMVRDNKYNSADEDPIPMAWYSYQQIPNLENMDVEVRAAGNPLALLSEIRRIVRDLDPNAPVQSPMVLSAQFEETYLMPALFARLGAFFGGLAALLVAVGLYGTLAYRVSRRTLEIGVSMALGAARQQVLWMILQDSLILIAAGLAVGSAAGVVRIEVDGDDAVQAAAARSGELCGGGVGGRGRVPGSSVAARAASSQRRTDAGAKDGVDEQRATKIQQKASKERCGPGKFDSGVCDAR